MAKIPLSIQILIAMALGLSIGAYTSTVFIGVNSMANAFVMLLQMTALPYISLSLITGIGGMSASKAAKILKVGLLVTIIITIVALIFILIAPLSFPNWETAEFYSANTVKVAKDFDLVSLFIAANPFNAYANALIPAVVLFSILIGMGMMQVNSKKQTLVTLTNLQDAIANINGFVMKIAPIGVFCIALRAAATINASEVDGLLVYVVTAATLVLLLSLLVVPAFVSIFTPFSYGQILKVCREAMITAFATGSFFAVLPIIIRKTQEAINHQGFNSVETGKLSSILVPISFSLPIGGKLIALLFSLFAAWFSGAYIGFNDYVNLIVFGLPQLFGTTSIAMPNLLDLFNVSNTMFEFYIVAENLVVARIGTLLSVIFSSCIPLVVASAIVNKITFKPKVFGIALVMVPLVSILLFNVLRIGFQNISYQYQGYDKFIDRDFQLVNVASKYLDKPKLNEVTPTPFVDVMTRIKQRGFIRAGYFRDDLPYSFHNKEGKLVGFDIELMNLLATDLGVEIEFVKIFHDQAEELLATGYLDITSGIPVTPDNMTKFTLTIPYSEQSIAFIVKDKRRAEFTRWKKILNDHELIIGIPETFFYKNAVKRNFDQSRAWEISTPRLFFKEEFQHIDGMLFGAAAASAWTLLYPEYTVVVPKPVQAPISMAFPIHKNDHNFELFMRNWITMHTQSDKIKSLFTYWVEGKNVQ